MISVNIVKYELFLLLEEGQKLPVFSECYREKAPLSFESNLLEKFSKEILIESSQK